MAGYQSKFQSATAATTLLRSETDEPKRISASTTMGGGFNASVMNGGKNLWGDSLMFFEPESEHSAASVCEGFAVAGDDMVIPITAGEPELAHAFIDFLDVPAVAAVP